MPYEEIHNIGQLMELIDRVGFLPLLNSGISGFSAEDMVDEECRYVTFPDGGWEWPLWEWKGSVITDGGYIYGKFFAGKAGFISRKWWPDFCNYRRSVHPMPDENSIEDAILQTLTLNGSMITRELRTACGFTGSRMRSKFDSYVTHLQMACRIVTENFVYPHDKHGKRYGWGWSLLTTPEQLYGSEFCKCPRSPEESFELIKHQLKSVCTDATDKQILKMLR